MLLDGCHGGGGAGSSIAHLQPTLICASPSSLSHPRTHFLYAHEGGQACASAPRFAEVPRPYDELYHAVLCCPLRSHQASLSPHSPRRRPSNAIASRRPQSSFRRVCVGVCGVLFYLCSCFVISVSSSVSAFCACIANKCLHRRRRLRIRCSPAPLLHSLCGRCGRRGRVRHLGGSRWDCVSVSVTRASAEVLMCGTVGT